MEEFLSYDVVRDWLRSPASAWLEQLQTQYPNLPAFQSASIPSELNGKIGLRLNASMSSNTSLYTSQTEVHTLTHATGLPTARDWRDFVQCPNFSMVRSFQCSGPSMIDFARELGATNLENLVELNLNSPTIGHQLAEIIGTTPFVGLSSLTLGPLNLEGIRALARSPFLGRLYRLNLTGSHFGDAGMKALVESPLADSLGHVSFPNKGLTDVSIEWLVNSPLFPRLQGTQLNLMMNQIGDAGLRILAESKKLMRFSELVLRENHIGNDGVAALADSPFAANLQYLDFWRNDIGDSGAIALADSPHLNKIVDLSLKENRLTTRGKDALSSRFGDRAKF